MVLIFIMSALLSFHCVSLPNGNERHPMKVRRWRLVFRLGLVKSLKRMNIQFSPALNLTYNKRTIHVLSIWLILDQCQAIIWLPYHSVLYIALSLPIPFSSPQVHLIPNLRANASTSLPWTQTLKDRENVCAQVIKHQNLGELSSQPNSYYKIV